MTNTEWLELAQAKKSEMMDLAVDVAREAISGKYLDGQRCVILLHDDGSISWHIENPNTLDGQVNAGTAIYAARLEVWGLCADDVNSAEENEEKWLDEAMEKIDTLIMGLQQKAELEA